MHPVSPSSYECQLIFKCHHAIHWYNICLDVDIVYVDENRPSCGVRQYVSMRDGDEVVYSTGCSTYIQTARTRGIRNIALNYKVKPS